MSFLKDGETGRYRISPGPGPARNIAPCITALGVAIIFSLCLSRSRSTWEPELVRAILRFFRVTLVLCIPFSFLFPVYTFIIRRMKKFLLRVEQDDPAIEPLKHWLFRPFQGIGIAFLFRTKLLAMLQLMGVPTVPASLLIPRESLDFKRLVFTSTVTALASLFLSTLWTLDDMGIRYANRRDQELKMVGKYVGTVMPVIFGTYGVMGVMANYPTAVALLAVFRAVLALYPPYVCFAVLHTYLIRQRKGFVDGRNMLERGGVWRSGR
jgi:hypothetical protein